MNKYFLREEKNKIFLCCGKSGCPSAEVDSDGMVVIKDDYGNSIKMKKGEAELLPKAIKKLNEKK